MIQFNLLPDVKVEYIKARKAKRMVIVVACVSVVVSAGLLAITISAMLYQKHHISSLDEQISATEKTLQGTTDLAKILTIQNQLNSLQTLYDQRPVTSRLFGYIQATTPSQVSMTHVNVDFTANTLTVDGTAPTLQAVNTYVDTLKFTTFNLKDDKTKTNAFSNVVLSAFTRDSKTASYKVSFSFAPDIFNATKTVELNVPSTVTTRSETEQPGNGVFDSGATN